MIRTTTMQSSRIWGVHLRLCRRPRPSTSSGACLAMFLRLLLQNRHTYRRRRRVTLLGSAYLRRRDLNGGARSSLICVVLFVVSSRHCTDTQTLVLIGNRNVARTSMQWDSFTLDRNGHHVTTIRFFVDVINLRRRLQDGRLESQYFLWLNNIVARVAH